MNDLYYSVKKTMNMKCFVLHNFTDPCVLHFINCCQQIKRRWNDDVVFRNQARDEPEHKKRFINDTIRSDFHRSFIKKFMK